MEGEKRRTPVLLGPLDRASLHHWTSLLPLHSPEDASRATFRNIVVIIFLIFYSSDDG
jgi:hypothetical protein